MRGTNDSMLIGHAEDVDGEAPGPIVGLLLPGPAPTARGHPGVVEEKVAGTLVGEDVRRQCLDRGCRRDVGDKAADAAVSAQLLDRRLEHGLLDIGDDDPCPLLQQRLGDAAADAGRSPGDNGYLAVQIIQRMPPFF